MLGPDHHHQLVARHRRAREMLALHRAFDEAQFRGCAFDGCRNLRRVADPETDLDLRMGAPKGDQVPRQPIIGDGLARLDRQRAAPEAAEFAQSQLGRFGARQHRPRLRQEHMTGFGQLDTPADPIEQLGVVL
jgi:hypothetical protein